MMSSAEIGSLAVVLTVLVASVHALGHVAERLRQPKLAGEILAGILLGPFVLDRVAPSLFEALFASSEKTGTVLGFLYWLGLLMLMFIAGSETRALLAPRNRRATAWILAVGTPLPVYLVLLVGWLGLLPLERLTGPAGQQTSALLVLATAVAVTSIPVISRIFLDLGIMHTRFVSLILGASLLEDMVLWGVLAVATALAKGAGLAGGTVAGEVGEHVAATLLFLLFALAVAPALLRPVHRARWNLVYRASRVGYVTFILFVYCSIAALLEVNLAFAAFLAGYGVVGGIGGSERERFSEALDALKRVSFAIFVPIYFALVGHRLVFGTEFSAALLLAFLLGSTALAVLAVGLAARLAGFRGLDTVNIALTMNARGGPGIVLASVAFDAGINGGGFYTTLVLAAVLTSQAAGAWLRSVLGRGWPLLSTDPDDGPAAGPALGGGRASSGPEQDLSSSAADRRAESGPPPPP